MEEYEKLYLYFYEDANVFADEDGYVVYHIFDFITPQNLYLFRHDYGFNVFPMKDDPEILVVLVLVADEMYARYEFPGLIF